MKKAVLFASFGLLAVMALSACAPAATGTPAADNRDSGQTGVPGSGGSEAKDSGDAGSGPVNGIAVGECNGADCDKPVSSDTPVSSGTKDPATQAPSEAKTVEAQAPIEKVTVNIAESYPPQYFLHVEYGLPSGCARPGAYKVERHEDVIKVYVTYSRPADPDVICTMIYGLAEHNIKLGSDFESGKTYTVYVNDTEHTFTAQ